MSMKSSSDKKQRFEEAVAWTGPFVHEKVLEITAALSKGRVLDIPCGQGALSERLRKQGFEIFCGDYDSDNYRIEGGNFHRLDLNCNLPYKDETFDLATCISVIEHLDITPDWKPIPYQDFIALTRRTLTEIARVLKKGGYLYLTSDAYEPRLQEGDNWGLGAIYDGIGAAYSIHDIEDIFVNTLMQAGLDLVNGYDYRPSLVTEDSQRCNYRGRYFTTFCVLAQKGGCQ